MCALVLGLRHLKRPVLLWIEISPAHFLETRLLCLLILYGPRPFELYTRIQRFLERSASSVNLSRRVPNVILKYRRVLTFSRAMSRLFTYSLRFVLSVISFPLTVVNTGLGLGYVIVPPSAWTTVVLRTVVSVSSVTVPLGIGFGH
jgi:hypothetical protein